MFSASRNISLITNGLKTIWTSHMVIFVINIWYWHVEEVHQSSKNGMIFKGAEFHFLHTVYSCLYYYGFFLFPQWLHFFKNTPSAAHKGITEATAGPFSPLVEHTEALACFSWFSCASCVKNGIKDLFCFDYCCNAMGQNSNGYNSNAMHAHYEYMQISMRYWIKFTTKFSHFITRHKTCSCNA